MWIKSEKSNFKNMLTGVLLQHLFGRDNLKAGIFAVEVIYLAINRLPPAVAHQGAFPASMKSFTQTLCRHPDYAESVGLSVGDIFLLTRHNPEYIHRAWRNSMAVVCRMT